MKKLFILKFLTTIFTIFIIMNLQDYIDRIKEVINIVSGSDDDLSKKFKNKSFDISDNFNSQIKELQSFLVDKGYDLGKFGPNKDGVDGKYGPTTKDAHEAFKKNISPDQFSGKKTDKTQKSIGNVDDKTLENEFNFHSIPDGKNNYRSAQIPVKINQKQYLPQVIDKYGIKTIIRLNGDGADSRHRSTHPSTSIQDEKKVAESKGVKFYQLSSTRDQDKVNSLLKGGNVLIHCAHGSDRTGGNVGGYLKEIGFGDTDKIWSYTTQYNGWNNMVKNNPNGFRSGGYLRQAQKFGVKNLDHAQRLARSK